MTNSEFLNLFIRGVSFVFSSWGSADYFSNIMSLLLFVVAYYLGLRQGRIIDQQSDIMKNVGKATDAIHQLEAAVAELQIREKIGVIKERTKQLKAGEDRVFTLRQDASSVLPLYEFASPRLRSEYDSALCGALTALRHHANDEGEPVINELVSILSNHIRQLEERGLKEHSKALKKCMNSSLSE